MSDNRRCEQQDRKLNMSTQKIKGTLRKTGIVEFRLDCPNCNAGISGRVEFSDPPEETPRCNCLVSLPVITEEGEQLCGICQLPH
jgi:hypothetical protein